MKKKKFIFILSSSQTLKVSSGKWFLWRQSDVYWQGDTWGHFNDALLFYLIHFKKVNGESYHIYEININ